MATPLDKKGIWLNINIIVHPNTPNTLNLTHISSEKLRQTNSFVTATKRKNNAHLLENLTQNCSGKFKVLPNKYFNNPLLKKVPTYKIAAKTTLIIVSFNLIKLLFPVKTVIPPITINNPEDIKEEIDNLRVNRNVIILIIKVIRINPVVAMTRSNFLYSIKKHTIGIISLRIFINDCIYFTCKKLMIIFKHILVIIASLILLNI
ncbi:hypothetical protein NOVO_07660 [Rickettsiales bacterium Ac37b]|nr:hypothetical protein NOVO_07660 [Rickettsiales bacterium Ac37b]